MKIWSSHLLDNLSNCLMNLKNSGDLMGFEPMTSASQRSWVQMKIWGSYLHLISKHCTSCHISFIQHKDAEVTLLMLLLIQNSFVLMRHSHPWKIKFLQKTISFVYCKRMQFSLLFVIFKHLLLCLWVCMFGGLWVILFW